MPGVQKWPNDWRKRLGWTLLDRDLLHQAAAVENVPDSELESLDEQEMRLGDRFRLHPPHNRYIHGLKEAVGLGSGRRGT